MLSAPIVIQVLLVLGVALGVYVVLVRPQLRRISAHAVFVAALKPGDSIVTSGGLLGRVVDCNGTLLTIELADGVCVRALRNSIESSFSPEAETIPVT